MLPLLILRLAFGALGLAGIGMNMNILVVISLSADIGFQGIELARGVRKKDAAISLTSLNFILIDSLAIIGIISGSWAFLGAAAVVNAIAMSFFGLKACGTGVVKRDPHACWQALSV